MWPKLFGIEHISYIIISTIIGILCVIISYKFAKTEKAKTIIIKILGILLFINLLVISLNKAFASNFIEDLQANYQIELDSFL